MIQTALNPQLCIQHTASTTTHGAYQRREGYLSDQDLLLGLDLLLLSRSHLLQLRESELHARVRHLQ